MAGMKLIGAGVGAVALIAAVTLVVIYTTREGPRDTPHVDAVVNRILERMPIIDGYVQILFSGLESIQHFRE
jgi:hypothetical protein